MSISITRCRYIGWRYIYKHTHYLWNIYTSKNTHTLSTYLKTHIKHGWRVPLEYAHIELRDKSYTYPSMGLVSSPGCSQLSRGKALVYIYIYIYIQLCTHMHSYVYVRVNPSVGSRHLNVRNWYIYISIQLSGLTPGLIGAATGRLGPGRRPNQACAWASSQGRLQSTRPGRIAPRSPANARCSRASKNISGGAIVFF